MAYSSAYAPAHDVFTLVHVFVTMQVSCLENLDIDTKDAAPFYRSIAMYGCKRTFQGSLTADSDQKDLDTWQSDWVYAYKLASAGMAAEFAWDYIEYLAYAFI